MKNRFVINSSRKCKLWFNSLSKYKSCTTNTSNNLASLALTLTTNWWIKFTSSYQFTSVFNVFMNLTHNLSKIFICLCLCQQNEHWKTRKQSHIFDIHPLAAQSTLLPQNVWIFLHFNRLERPLGWTSVVISWLWCVLL